ncbi:MAG: hypothetical protein ACRC5Q_07400, partial [Culicoidibacterales bacterium]
MKISWQGRVMKISSKLSSRQQQQSQPSLSKQRQQELQLAKLQPLAKDIQLTQWQLFGHKIE